MEIHVKNYLLGVSVTIYYPSFPYDHSFEHSIWKRFFYDQTWWNL